MKIIEYILIGIPLAMIVIVVAALIKDMIDYPYGE